MLCCQGRDTGTDSLLCCVSLPRQGSDTGTQRQGRDTQSAVSGIVAIILCSAVVSSADV
jgi:hypothetical protein